VRHQNQNRVDNNQKQANNPPQTQPQPQQPTRRAFVSELPNTDEEEVIYQNPVHGVYRDPYVTIHYPVESRFNFQHRQQRGRGLLDVSPDASQLFTGSTRMPTNPPSYSDFHLNNIPTTLPPQPTEASDFHYILSAVKPKVVHEKDRKMAKKGKSKEVKEAKEVKAGQLRRPTGLVFYCEC